MSGVATVRHHAGDTLQQTRLLSTRSALSHELYIRWAARGAPRHSVETEGDEKQPAWLLALHHRSTATAERRAPASLAALSTVASFLALNDASAASITSHGAMVVWSALRPALPLERASASSPAPRRDRRLLEAMLCYMRAVLMDVQRKWLGVLPPIDRAGAQQLRAQLCESTNNGTMPSFDVGDGALSGYIHGNFRARAVNIVLLLVHEPLAAPMLLRAFGRRSSAREAPLRVVDVGGGPGFSPLGLQALAEYLGCGGAVHGISAEYEAAWAPSTAAAEPIVRARAARATHRFCCCDLLDDARASARAERPAAEASVEREALTELVRSAASIVIFSFVVVENAVALRALEWRPVAAVCRALRRGGLLVFCDSTHRLWAEVLLVALQHGDFDVSIPCVRSRYSLVLRKRLAPSHSGSAAAAAGALDETNEAEGASGELSAVQWREVQRQMALLGAFAATYVTVTGAHVGVVAAVPSETASLERARAPPAPRARGKGRGKGRRKGQGKARVGLVAAASDRFDALSAAAAGALLGPLRLALGGRAAALSARQLWTLALFTAHRDDHARRLERQERERASPQASEVEVVHVY
jgi:hypothetical protein